MRGMPPMHSLLPASLIPTLPRHSRYVAATYTAADLSSATDMPCAAHRTACVMAAMHPLRTRVRAADHILLDMRCKRAFPVNATKVAHWCTHCVRLGLAAGRSPRRRKSLKKTDRWPTSEENPASEEEKPSEKKSSDEKVRLGDEMCSGTAACLPDAGHCKTALNGALRLASMCTSASAQCLDHRVDVQCSSQPLRSLA